MTAGTVRKLVGQGRGGWVPRGLAGPTSDELRALCADEGWTFMEVNVAGVADKASLMSRLAAQLGFPDYFGHNWDAVADCLSELAPGASGVVLRLKGLWQMPQGFVEPLVEVLDECVRASSAGDNTTAARTLAENAGEAPVAGGPPPLLIVADPPLPPRD